MEQRVGLVNGLSHPGDIADWGELADQHAVVRNRGAQCADVLCFGVDLGNLGGRLKADGGEIRPRWC